MELYQINLYMEDVEAVCGLPLPWEKLKGKTMMLSGATGLLGSFLIDVIMRKNRQEGLNCQVLALGRNRGKAEKRFPDYFEGDCFNFISYDVKEPFVRDDLGTVDYILHLASNTHPMQYSTDPIGTITTNIIGLQNMLEFAADHQAARFALRPPMKFTGKTGATWNCLMKTTADISIPTP